MYVCDSHGKLCMKQACAAMIHSALVSQKMAMFFRGFCPRAARPLPKALTSLYTWSYDIQRYCPESPTEKHCRCETVFLLSCSSRTIVTLFSAFYQLLPFHWMRLYNCIDQQLLLLVHYIVTIHGELTGIFSTFFNHLTYFLLLLSHIYLAKVFF